MDTKWTPGPWTTGIVDADEDSWFEIRAKTEDGGWTIVAHGIDSDADAYLAAAAPELDAALRNLLALYQSQHRETTPEEVAAEYALAKARGEAQ